MAYSQNDFPMPPELERAMLLNLEEAERNAKNYLYDAFREEADEQLEKIGKYMIRQNMPAEEVKKFTDHLKACSEEYIKTETEEYRKTVKHSAVYLERDPTNPDEEKRYY